MNFLAKIQALIAALTGNVVTVTVALSEKPVVVEDSAATAAIVPANVATTPTRPSGDQAKAKLTELLNHPQYKFRSISKLSKALGIANRWEVEELLSSIGARPSRRNPELFGLTSRIGQRSGVRSY